MNCVIGITLIIKIDESITIFDRDISNFAEAFEKLLEIPLTNIAADIANIYSLA